MWCSSGMGFGPLFFCPLSFDSQSFPTSWLQLLHRCKWLIWVLCSLYVIDCASSFLWCLQSMTNSRKHPVPWNVLFQRCHWGSVAELSSTSNTWFSNSMIWSKQKIHGYHLKTLPTPQCFPVYIQPAMKLLGSLLATSRFETININSSSIISSLENQKLKLYDSDYWPEEWYEPHLWPWVIHGFLNCI